jgi:aminoglycoside phosphotransferase (APT) family kinase protein
MPQPLAADDVVESFDDVAADAREPLLVLGPLRAFLADHGLDAPDELSAEAIGDGHSNVTFALSTGVVLRRPPRGPLPPSAHDVLREARLLTALFPTRVRVPRVYAVCEDASVIGAPFYVMELIPGAVITTALPPALDTTEQRRLVASQLIDSLVELHGADWRAAGLEGFGKPSGYVERQVRRFSGLWEMNKTREVPAVDEVAQWLVQNLPESGPATIVHGDFRLGNVIYGCDAPARLDAILDWEMATIGDPLADLAYLLTHWYQSGDPVTPFTLQTVTAAEGFPSRDQLVAIYESRSGRALRDVDWYVTLAIWKGVVFMEGNYKRAIAGTNDDPWTAKFGEAIEGLAERALDVTRNGF